MLQTINAGEGVERKEPSWSSIFNYISPPTCARISSYSLTLSIFTSSQIHLVLGVSFFSCLTFSCLYFHIKWCKGWKPQCLLNFARFYILRPMLKSLSAHPSFLPSSPLSRFCSPFNMLSASVFCIVWLPPASSPTDSVHFDQIQLSSMPLSSLHFSAQKPSGVFPLMSEWSQDSLAWHIFALEYISTYLSLAPNWELSPMPLLRTFCIPGIALPLLSPSSTCLFSAPTPVTVFSAHLTQWITLY